jgi:hypothetical protein
MVMVMVMAMVMVMVIPIMIRKNNDDGTVIMEHVTTT